MSQATQEVLVQRLNALVEGLDPAECETLMVELAEHILMSRYGFVFDEDMKEMNPGAFDKTTTYQKINDGKAILISPKGYEIVSEENVGRNGCYRVTLRECKRSSFDNEERAARIPHLERGGFIKRYQSRKR